MAAPADAPEAKSIHGPALSGWTWHQSHGQVTALFYVSLAAKDRDVQVIIAPNYVVAGIRGYEPVLKARLYARIDPSASSWQLERPANRSRTRNRSRTSASRSASTSASVSTRSASGSGSGSGSGSARHSSGSGNESSSSHGHDHARGKRSQPQHGGERAKRVASGQRPREDLAGARSAGRGHLSPTASRAASPSESASSYELLQRSTGSLSTASSLSNPSPGLSTDSDSFVPLRTAAAAGTSSPATVQIPDRTASTSTAASPTSSFGESDPLGVASLHSSLHLGSATSHPSSGDTGEEMAARLVTVHLTKIDGGMWPMLISGPAPRHAESPDDGNNTLKESPSQVRLSAALSEALATGGSPKPGEALPTASPPEYDEGESPFKSPNPAGESTTSLHSDDSHTVLAHRRQSLEDAARDEAKFNMDPVSLALIGCQLRTSLPFRQHGWDEALEYFIRSWRKADLPTATRLLVEDYFPLVHPDQDSSQSHALDQRYPTPSAPSLGSLFFGSAFIRGEDVAGRQRQSQQQQASKQGPPPNYRPRMVAALGGNTALARLYVSYARLSLTTAVSQHQRSSLFPAGLGHSRDPYSGDDRQSYGYGYAYAGTDYGSPSRSASSPPSSPPAGRAQLGSQMFSHPHSPHSQTQQYLTDAQHTLRYGPLAYLEEARRLDPSVHIDPAELREAQHIAELAQAEARADAEAMALADDMVSVGESSEADHLYPSGATRGSTYPGGKKRRRRREAKGSRDRGEDRSSGRQRSSLRSKKGTGASSYLSRSGSGAASPSAPDSSGKYGGKGSRAAPVDDAGLVAVLSGAALLSFVVAGSVAVLGWWKRGPGATN